jgi:hypothetical protein
MIGEISPLHPQCGSECNRLVTPVDMAEMVVGDRVDFFAKVQEALRYVPAVCLLILLSAVTATAQILPTSNGSCRVTASGLESCNWMSGVSHEKAHNDTDGPRSQLFVTRCILAPGAALNPSVEGRDVLIVGMNNGELVNEKDHSGPRGLVDPG